MLYLQEQFLVRILYKSGNYADFWVSEFRIKREGPSTEASWKSVTDARPIVLNVDEIEAVWQLETRTKLRFGRPEK